MTASKIVQPTYWSAVELTRNAQNIVTFTKLAVARDLMSHLQTLDVVQVQVYDTLHNTIQFIGSDACDVAIVNAATYSTVTLHPNLDPNITIVLRVDVGSKGLEYWAPSVTVPTTSRYCIQGVVWPRYLFAPTLLGNPDTLYAVCTYTSGFVFRKPHVDANLISSWPDTMQFTSLFNSANKDILHWWRDDENESRAFWVGAGDGSYFKSEFVHLADRRYVPGSWPAIKSKIRMERFTGKSRDGRYCAIDCALEYRKWAAQPSRPWRARGLWKDADASSFSPRVKTATLYITYSADNLTGSRATQIQTDLTRLQTLVGPFTTPYVVVYGWQNKVFDTRNPDPIPNGAIDSTFKSMVSTLQGNTYDVSIILYHLSRVWDGNNPTGWKPSNYTPVDASIPTDLTPYCFHTRTGAVRTNSRTVSSIAVQDIWSDYFHVSIWPYVTVDIMKRLYQNFTTVPNGGLYWDAGSGLFLVDPLVTNLTVYTDVNGISGDWDDAPSESTWTIKQYLAGRQLCMRAMRDYGVLACGTTFQLTAEWPDQTVVQCVDYQFFDDMFGNLGQWAGLNCCVYGDIVRFADFGQPQVGVNDISQNLFVSVVQTRVWLRSGVVSFNNSLIDTAFPDLVYPSLTDSPLYYYLIWIKKLADASAWCRPYFEGHMVRPVMTDWFAEAIADNYHVGAGSGWSGWAVAKGGLDAALSSETWQKDNGDLGVMVGYCYPGAAQILPAHLPFFFASPPKTVTLKFSTNLDELPAGTKSVYRTVAGVRTLLGTFTQEFQTTQTFNPWDLVLFEVVKS